MSTQAQIEEIERIKELRDKYLDPNGETTSFDDDAKFMLGLIGRLTASQVAAPTSQEIAEIESIHRRDEIDFNKPGRHSLKAAGIHHHRATLLRALKAQRPTATFQDGIEAAAKMLNAEAAGLRTFEARTDQEAKIHDAIIVYIEELAQKIRALSPQPAGDGRDKRQADVIAWVRRCFGDACAEDGQERGARVLEEAIELAQAAGLPKDKALHLVEHVYSKPVGAINQEIGGVSVTLLSFAAYAGLSAEAEEIREVERVLSLPVDHFKRRHIEKAAAGITKSPPQPAGDNLQTKEK